MSGNRVLLDTNIIIYLSQRKISVDSVFYNGIKYYVSIISYMELLSFNFENRNEERLIVDILTKLEIVALDMEIANSVVKLKKERKIKLPDAIIVSTAIVKKLTLFTNDKQLLNISGLKVKEIE